jgi:predicted NBD/HSP70 family sugar kinase
LRGAYDIGGAVGWIPVFQDGVVRHFEEVAAGPGVERQAREVLQCTDALPALAQSARAGSQPLIDLFARVGERIGEVLSIFVSTFNPEIIVLGGGVSQAWDLFGLTALQAMRRWSQPISVEQVEVAVSQLGEDAGILGAAAAVRWEVGGSGRSL